jgi:hypothetical protein
MDNKNLIMDYLQKSSSEYDEYLLQTYWAWCKKNGVTKAHTQQLFANTIISNWWMCEFSKLELQFIKTYDCLIKRKDIIDSSYYSFTSQINHLYPKALINAIKVDKDFKYDSELCLN